MVENLLAILLSLPIFQISIERSHDILSSTLQSRRRLWYEIMGPSGEIKPIEKITKKEFDSEKWIPLSLEQFNHLKNKNRKERRAYYKRNALFKNGKWGWCKV